MTTLTQTQRDQWTTYGANVPVLNRFGDSINLTGLNHYIRSNIPRLITTLPRVDDGPVIFGLPEADNLANAAYAADDQKVSVSFDDTLDIYDEDQSAILTYCGLPVNPSINFFGSPFRFVDVIAGSSTTPPTSPTELDYPFTMQEDQQVFHKFRITLADGRLSEFFRLGSASVTAT
jgi:hypothetical protein